MFKRGESFFYVEFSSFHIRHPLDKKLGANLLYEYPIIYRFKSVNYRYAILGLK